MLISYQVKGVFARAIKYLKNRKSDGVFKHSLVLMLFTVGTAVFNILFRKYMATSHSVIGFGIYTPLLAVYSILAVPFSGFPMLLSRMMSPLVKEERYGEAFAIYHRFSWFFLIIVVVFSVSICVALPFMRGFERIIGSFLPLFLIALLFVANSLNSIAVTVFQPFQMFHVVGSLGLVVSILKFLVAFLFFNFLTSFGIQRYNLALLSFVVATFFSAAIAHYLIKKKIKKNKVRAVPQVSLQYKDILRPFFPIAILLLLYGIQRALDEIIVKHYFNNHDAGIYSAVISVGKASVFLVVSIVYVLYPKISSSLKNAKDSKRIMGKGLVLAGMGSLAGFVGVLLFPEFIVSLLTHAKFVSAAQYIPIFYLSYLPYSFIYFFVTYFILHNDWRFIAGFAALTIMQVLMFLFFHGTITEVIAVLGISGVVILTYTLFYWFFSIEKKLAKQRVD